MNTNETKKRSVSTSAVVRIVIWSVVLCLLTGFFVGGMMKEGFGGFFTGLHIGGYSYDDKGFSVGNGRTRENITELSIDWLEGSVTVRATEGDEVVITEDYDGEKGSHRLRWKIEDGELTIKYCKPRRWGSFDIESKNLIVEIPGAMLEVLRDAEIIAVDCDVTYEGNADELSLDMEDGDVSIHYGQQENVDIYAKLTPQVMEEILGGRMTFQRAFMTGEMTAKGNFKTLRMLDNLFAF